MTNDIYDLAQATPNEDPNKEIILLAKLMEQCEDLVLRAAQLEESL